MPIWAAAITAGGAVLGSSIATFGADEHDEDPLKKEKARSQKHLNNTVLQQDGQQKMLYPSAAHPAATKVAGAAREESTP